MSRWIPITLADLEDSKVAKLVTALRTKALQTVPAQTDPSPRITQSVVTDIRRKIASCASNRVDSDETTIPASLLPLATDLIIFRLKNRLEIELTQDERDTRREHTETLNRIASCADVVDQPDDPISPEVESTSGTPSISNERATARRARRSGL